MKKQKNGFIQLAVLIPVIVGIVVGIGGYVGVSKYRDHSADEPEAEQVIVKEAVAEVEETKTTSDTQSVKKAEPSKNISSDTEDSYSKVPISSVVQLFCTQNPNGVPDLNNAASGSGTFVTNGSGLIVTNSHVVKDDSNSTCAVFMRDTRNSTKPIILFADVLAVAVNSDAAFLQPNYFMTDEQGNWTDGLVEIPDNYNYPRKSQSCNESDIKIGAKLVVVGYPAVGGRTVTLTEGIVSGFDGDYIKTSAKIEQGGSGGGAFLIPSGCWIGIPTSSAVGELESLGRILRWDA